MKIFLDVGAHTGESLIAAMEPEFGFGRIVCFEPVKSCLPKLKALADKRVSIEPFGLWDRDCERPVFQPGSKGAGMWKKDNGRTDETEICRFVRASDWMCRNVQPSDTVFLKINCEGAECDILDDLLDSGEFAKVSFVMVDFDVRKIESMRHRQAEVQERLAIYPFPRVATSKQVMRGETHQERIKNWLRLCA